MVTKKLLISGKVQGVSFRFHTHGEAVRLELRGWVQNLKDGRVELVIAGSDHAVAQMVDWARQGPQLAKVEKVEISDLKNSDVTDIPFFIKR